MGTRNKNILLYYWRKAEVTRKIMYIHVHVGLLGLQVVPLSMKQLACFGEWFKKSHEPFITHIDRRRYRITVKVLITCRVPPGIGYKAMQNEIFVSHPCLHIHQTPHVYF